MALIVNIKVIPNSGRQKFVLDKSGILRCYLKSPPEGGKANAELIKLLSKKLSIIKEDIKIVLGATGRKKRIKINLDINFDELISRLGIEEQLTIN